MNCNFGKISDRPCAAVCSDSPRTPRQGQLRQSESHIHAHAGSPVNQWSQPFWVLGFQSISKRPKGPRPSRLIRYCIVNHGYGLIEYWSLICFSPAMATHGLLASPTFDMSTFTVFMIVLPLCYLFFVRHLRFCHRYSNKMLISSACIGPRFILRQFWIEVQVIQGEVRYISVITVFPELQVLRAVFRFHEEQQLFHWGLRLFQIVVPQRWKHSLPWSHIL